MLSVGHDIAGYFELQRHPDRTVEVMYFGLAHGVHRPRDSADGSSPAPSEEAFALGAPRVIAQHLHARRTTALPNYLARGFTIVREDQYLLDVPETGVLRQSEQPRLTTRS